MRSSEDFTSLQINDEEHILEDSSETYVTGSAFDGPIGYTQLKGKETACGDTYVWAITEVMDGSKTGPGYRKVPHSEGGGHTVVSDPSKPMVKPRVEKSLFKLTEDGQEAFESRKELGEIQEERLDDGTSVQQMLESVYRNEVDDISEDAEIYASIIGSLFGNENGYAEDHIEWEDKGHDTFRNGDFRRYDESWDIDWRGCEGCEP